MKTAKDIALTGVYTALLIGAQVALSALSGIEVVTVLLLSFCYCFGIARGLAVRIFSFRSHFIFGLLQHIRRCIRASRQKVQRGSQGERTCFYPVCGGFDDGVFYRSGRYNHSAVLRLYRQRGKGLRGCFCCCRHTADGLRNNNRDGCLPRPLQCVQAQFYVTLTALNKLILNFFSKARPLPRSGFTHYF